MLCSVKQYGEHTSDEYERMWKGAVVAHFMALSLHFNAGNEDNYKQTQDSWSLNQDLNLGPP
jgi:hypothetical protein